MKTNDFFKKNWKQKGSKCPLHTVKLLTSYVNDTNDKFNYQTPMWNTTYDKVEQYAMMHIEEYWPSFIKDKRWLDIVGEAPKHKWNGNDLYYK
jgi:hypothetical protein